MAQLTIWVGGFEKSIRLWKVGKVELFKVVGCTRMGKADHIMTSGFVCFVDGASEDTRRP